MCWSATYRLIMQCFGFAVPEVSTESLLIDQPAVRSDTDEHQPIDGLSLRMEGGGMGMVSQSVRQPMETVPADPLPEPDRPAAAATSYNMSPLLQPTAVSSPGPPPSTTNLSLRPAHSTRPHPRLHPRSRHRSRPQPHPRPN